MKLHMRIAIFTIILIAILGVSLLSCTTTASAPEQVLSSCAPPKPDHENDHPYFEYVGTVTKLVPIVIINSPPKGYAEGKASFTAVFSYNIRNNFIDLQKVSSNTLIFNVRAKDGGVAGAFAEVRLDIYNVYVCNYVNPDGCEYVDTIAEVDKVLGFTPVVIVRESSNQTFIPVQVFKDGIPSVKFDVRFKESPNNIVVDTTGYDDEFRVEVQSSALMTISTGFFYEGEYLHGLLKVTYGNSVEKDITYTFPPGCVWRVHPLGDSVTSAWSFKLLKCVETG